MNGEQSKVTFREKLKGVWEAIRAALSTGWSAFSSCWTPGRLIWLMILLGLTIIFCTIRWYTLVCQGGDVSGGWCGTIRNGFPWTLLMALAASPAIVLAWYRREKHKRENLEVAREGQVVERFTKTDGSFDIELEQIRLERLKVFAKVATVLVTVIIGTFGVALLNTSIQEAELELQRNRDMTAIQKTEMAYLGDLLEHALTDDRKKRLLFSEYFAELTVSPELRSRWVGYHTKIRSDFEAYERAKEELVSAREKGQIRKVERLSTEVGRLKERLAPVLGERLTLAATRKIIHLSDLGIKGSDDERAELDCIVDSIIREARPPAEYVVVITGDLVDDPTESNLLFVKERINTLESAGYVVLVVPGNHDYAKMGIMYSPEIERRFNRIFWGRETVEFPKIDVIDNITFIGLDTLGHRDAQSPMDYARGHLGSEQLSALDSLLSRDDGTATTYRVLYFHHSPFPAASVRALDDWEALGEILRKQSSIHLMLFGDSHRFVGYHGTMGVDRSYSAGASTSVNVNTRIIDLTKDREYDYVVDLGCKGRNKQK